VATVPTTIAISFTANPTLTSKGVMLKGSVEPAVTSKGGAMPTGTVSWTVTSANGQSLLCASGTTTLGKARNPSCRIPAHELSAADGPYTATISYPGDSHFSASNQTLTFPVSKANSRTRLAMQTQAGPKSPTSIFTKVTGVSSSAGTPTGTVTFDVSGSSGPVRCHGDTNTLRLSSGVATCTISPAPVAVGSPYTVRVAYSGDGNFNTSMSAPRSLQSEPASSSASVAPTTSAGTLGNESASAPAGMSSPPGYTSTQLIFDDQFTGTTLNTTKWNTFMARQGSRWIGPDGYSATGINTHQTFFDPARVVVNNGLSITMTYDPTYSEDGWNTRSGCITTWNKFTFSSGYVQVKAEMPDSTAGQWPAIWLLPNDAPAGGSNGDEELDMHEGGFLPNETGMPSNTPINNNFAPNYHQPSGAAVISPAGSVSSAPLDTGYHIYGMEIIAGKSMKFYLDGTLVSQTTVGVPTEPWELVIWNAFATSAASGYHSTGNASALTPSILHVAEVQVYS
jgi:beta-glucanase (GH16 family)